MNFYRQPLNLSLGLNNEAHAKQLKATTSVQEASSVTEETYVQDDIQAILGLREPIVSTGCLLEATLPNGYWQIAAAPRIAICRSCHKTFIQPSALAGQWQYVAGDGIGAVCDMPVKAIRDAWKSALVHARSEDVQACVQRFAQQAHAILTQFETTQRHINALNSTMQYFQRLPVQTSESASIIAAKQQEIARLLEDQNRLTGRDAYGRLNWM